VRLLAALLPAPATGPAQAVATTAAASNSATVFCSTHTPDWPAYNLHWAPDGGSWTTLPGVAMDAACTGWVKKTVDLGSATDWRPPSTTARAPGTTTAAGTTRWARAPSRSTTG
jgi:hypothetical protein